MKLPCEQAMWYTLPKVRAELARELVKKELSQKEAAQRLGVTSAAVSQYLHKKRGEKIKFSQEQKRLIVEASEELFKSSDEKAVIALICRCCKQP